MDILPKNQDIHFFVLFIQKWLKTGKRIAYRYALNAIA